MLIRFQCCLLDTGLRRVMDSAYSLPCSRLLHAETCAPDGAVRMNFCSNTTPVFTRWTFFQRHKIHNIHGISINIYYFGICIF